MSNKDEALKMAIEWFERKGYSNDRQPILEALQKALEQEPLNLNCKSVQKRLATQWGYVEQPTQEPVGYYYPDERSAYLLFQKGLEIPKDALPLYESFAPSWQGLDEQHTKRLLASLLYNKELAPHHIGAIEELLGYPTIENVKEMAGLK